MDRSRRDDFNSSLSFALLRTYTRVVELGSMTRAAQALFLAQSAVSTHVSTLATQAGGPLLERRDGQLVTTRLGRILYDEACEVIARVAQLEKRLREASSAAHSEIPVSCTRTVCETSIAKIVAEFGHAHPETRLAISHGTAKDAEVRLRLGHVEVALVEGQEYLPGMRAEPFHEDRLVLAVPKGHPLAGARFTTFAEAARYPFILRGPSSGTRLLIEQRLGRRFEQLAIAFELEGNAEVVSCVEEGIGLAFLSETAIAAAQALGTIDAVEITDIDLSRTFYVVVPEDRPLDGEAAAFVAWLTERFARRRVAVPA
jgi:DNA-binding transcriptional LysR family regulator